MVSRIFQFLVMATLPVLVMGCSKASDEVTGLPATPAQMQQIHAAFDAYRDAMIQADTARIQSLITLESLAFFEQVRDLAASGGPDQMASQPLVVQMMVGSLRVRGTPKSISAMTSQSVLQEAIRQRWINPQTVIDAELYEITVDGLKAMAIFKVEDDRVNDPWLFFNEEGTWKVDMTAPIDAIDDALEQSLEDSELSRDDFIMEALRSSLQRPVSRSIWQVSSAATQIAISVKVVVFIIDPAATDGGSTSVKSLLAGASSANSSGGRLTRAQQSQLWASLDRAIAANSAEILSKPSIQVLSSQSARMSISSPTLGPRGVTIARQDLYLSVKPVARPNGKVVLEYSMQTKNVSGRFSILMDQAGLPIAARTQGAGAGAVTSDEALFLRRPFVDKELVLIITAAQSGNP